MFIRLRQFAVGLTIVGLCVSGSASAAVIGDKLTCTSTFFSCSPTEAPLSNGVEFKVFVDTTDSYFSRNPISFDFTTNALTLTTLGVWPATDSTFTFSDATNPFATASLTSSNAVAKPSVSVTGGNLVVYFPDQIGRNKTVKINFTSDVVVVPEPATWGIMLIAIGTVGAVSRYRRRRATITVA